MNIVQKVKNFVENECKNPNSKYDSEFFSCHLVNMAGHAEKLLDEFGGDREVVLLTVWLHDIGSIIHGRENHHITGPKIAEIKLRELKYPSEKIELVKKCILNHRSSQERDRESTEEKIVSDADALSNFDNLTGLFTNALVTESKNQIEAKESVKNKLRRKWNQLHFESSRKMIKPKFEAAMLLLK